MSFTGAYSQLYRLKDGQELPHAPRILDKNKFERAKEEGPFSVSTFEKIMMTDEKTEHGEYPKSIYEVLYGFKTHKAEDAIKMDIKDGSFNHNEATFFGYLGRNFNIERFAIEYTGGITEEFIALWELVSEATDPFVVYHAPTRNSFMNLAELEYDNEETHTVYRIIADDGDVTVEEITWERQGKEVLTDD